MTTGLLPAALFVFGVTAVAPAQTLIHSYQFNGDYTDELGGPSIVPNGGSIDATRHTFPAGQGLTLTNGLDDTADYSIAMVMEFDALSPLWKRVIDFKEKSTDNGVYIVLSNLQFWPLVTGADAVVANTDFHLIVTRDSASATVKGYLNGDLQWSFADANNAVPPNNIVIFFEDDGPSEHAAGSVDCIRIYDGALSDAQAAVVAAAMCPPAGIPTVGEWGLIVMGLLLTGGLAVVVRRMYTQRDLAVA